MMTKNKAFYALFGLIASFFVTTLTCDSTFAYTLIEQKALGKGIYDCYKYATTSKGDHVLVGSIKPTEMTSGYESIVLNNSEKYVGLPSGFDSWQSLTDNNVSCRQLFGGYEGGGFGGNFSGLLTAGGISEKPTADQKVDFLTNVFGYKMSSSVSSSGECFKVKMNVWENGSMPYSHDVTTSAICSSDGSMSSSSISIQDTGTDVLTFKKSGDTITMEMLTCYSEAGMPDNSDKRCSGYESMNSKGYQISSYSSFNDLVSDISSDVSRHFAPGSAYINDERASINTSDFIDRYPYGESSEATYTIADTHGNDNRGKAAFVAMGSLLGASFDSYDDLKFEDEETFSLYRKYLDGFYGAFPPTCDYGSDSGTNESALKSAGYISISYNNGSGIKTCYVKATQHTDSYDDSSKVYGIDSSGYFGRQMTFAEVVAEYSALTQAGLIDDGSLPDPESSGGSVNSNSENDDAVCYRDSGAIGWILCPAIKGIASVGESLWRDVENKYMQIPAGKIFEEGSSVAQGWGIVRDIANVLFIALFLFVIFSQLTGFGIDNYGIKKIMPKLITVAILMNLSFLICGLAVDLSNILGEGLKNLFGNASIVTSNSIAFGEGSQTAATIVGAALAGGGVALYAAFSGLGVIGIGLAVLGTLITVVVAVLTLYLILIIREAGVVIAIVISPLAIVCYMLPNTEKLYKRWFDLFKALLVVYPICGALVGGGKLASAVLGGIEGMGLAAMIVQVLPFFLIPMLLRQSLALMGNVGTRLSTFGRNIGRRASTGAQNGIRNTNAVKDYAQHRQDRQLYRSATRVRNRLNGRTDLNARQQERLRKAEDVILAQNKKTAENEARVGGAYFEAMGHKQDLERENEQAVVEQYNRESFRDAKRATMADDIRRQQSKERTTLMMNGEYNGVRYSQMGLPQLQSRWEQIFRNDNNEYAGRENERLADLDALTNVMFQRYGTSAANSVGQSLSRMHGVAGNATYQRSLRTLQQTMTDNSTLSGNLKNKAPDAFQMISDAGMRYDQAANGGAGGMVYEDLDWFSGHNSTATQAKDWATASGATLQRAVDNNMLSERMINELLTSEDPAIRSGLQSEDGKREILEAALYNKQNNLSLPSAQAAQRYENEQVTQQAQNELHIRHEREAERRGKTKINVPGQGSFDGYAVPDGFRTVGGVVRIKREANGDWIYTDVDSGRQWNASTGTYKT